MARLIYQPKGKAREYSPWACNLYNGCSHRCAYCYNRKGNRAWLLGKNDVTPKSGASVELFTKELLRYKDRIIEDGKGLFFSFVSDPFLRETIDLTLACAKVSIDNGVKVVFLSKVVPESDFFIEHKDMVKVGFTLTGMDRLEPYASSNDCRVREIEFLESNGVRTWASIEPVIDLYRSLEMIKMAYAAGCREFKIGLLSGRKEYTQIGVMKLVDYVKETYTDCDLMFKESVVEYIK